MAKSRDFVSPRNSRNQKSTRTNSFRHVVCLTMAATVATMSLGFSGCCSRNGGCGVGGGWGFADRIIEEQVNCLRDCVWSKRAFHMRYGHCERVHADHFKQGFCSGYTNICDGGTGQCPALPPEKYWSFEYRTREGAEMQNAWFAGYEAGASSAKTDGAGSFYGVQVHRDLINDMLREEQVKNVQSGIRVQSPQGMTPVLDASAMEIGGAQPGMPYTQSGMPYSNTPYVPGNMLPGEGAIPVTTPVIPDAGTATTQGARSGPPLPMQMMPSSIPTVPAIPNR
ncbi:MAG: hypothetical protein ACR2NP_07080 [Pirellulaceae bacterium]